MEPPPRLAWSQRISYGVGHCLNDLTASMWFSYMIVYLQLVLGFDSNYAGLILLIGQVADAIATPLLGYELSNSGGSRLCKKYGRRKFLHLIGTIFVVVSFPFMFSICPGCENASQFAYTIMLIPLVVIFQVGWASVQVSHLSLIPAMTPHESERDFLNVLRYAFDIGSDISTYIIVWAVFDLTRTPSGSHNTITGEYANKFMLIVIVVVGIGALFSVIFHIGVKEKTGTPLSSAENSLEKDPKSAALQNKESIFPDNLSWRGWIREVHFYQVGFIYMFVRLYQNMSNVFMPLYLNETLKANDDLIAKIPLVMNLSAFVISCALPKFFKVFNKKGTFLGAAAVGVGSCVWVAAGRGPSYNTKGIYGVGVTMGAASSIMVVCALSFTHDLIGKSAESGAFVYGCMSFWDKLANGVAGMIIQHMHSVSCKKCDWFYRDVLTYFVGGTAIIASVLLLCMCSDTLGKRKSAYNGAEPSTDTEEHEKLAVESDETKPLLSPEQKP